MKTTIQIKSISGDVLYEHTCEDNSVKKAVDEAIKNKKPLSGADLSGTNLSDADLRSANLSGADLRGANLSDAYLCNADLRSANLSDADLRSANLSGADLSYANLRGANLRGAYLCNADLSGTNLCGADLCGADLCGADLSGADLSGTNLSGADLCGADLCGADLCGADLEKIRASDTTSMFFPQCPDGEFIGYKTAGGKIVKLLIPEDAKRSSAATLKCRCSKAKVLEIQEEDGSPSEVKEVRSNYDKGFIYRLGETVCVENFDEDRWNECSRGIHFFISRDAAVSYEG